MIFVFILGRDGIIRKGLFEYGGIFWEFLIDVIRYLLKVSVFKFLIFSFVLNVMGLIMMLIRL